jgi:hypothetical protein
MVGQAAPKTKKQLMDEALQKKLDDFTRAVERKCASVIRTRAEEIVDSLLLLDAQIKTVDTFKRPPTPNKPQRPEIKSTKDTTDIRPLFEESGGE